jgi:hypothetical protein
VLHCKDGRIALHEVNQTWATDELLQSEREAALG